MTTTAVADRPVIRDPARRTLLSLVLASTLAFGAGAALVAATSSGDATVGRAKAAPAVATKVDVHALWDQLSTMPVGEADSIVSGLDPTVRAQLRSIAEAAGADAEHH